MIACLLALIIGTWNGQWFPSGRAEHRADAKTEARTIQRAGKLLRQGLDEMDPSGKEDIILCLNEMRDRETVEALCAAIGREKLKLAIISGYRRRDRFDTQQDAIITTLPVPTAHWSKWKQKKKLIPPRGYAYAEIAVTPAVTAAVYAVHLKSNYGATTEKIRADNRDKRSLPVAQLMEQEKPKRGAAARATIVAGDFNADCWREDFSDETIFTAFASGGFLNALAALPEDERVTHPNRRYGDSVLDYVMLRAFKIVGKPLVVPVESVSDHYAVFVRVATDPQSR